MNAWGFWTGLPGLEIKAIGSKLDLPVIFVLNEHKSHLQSPQNKLV